LLLMLGVPGLAPVLVPGLAPVSVPGPVPVLVAGLAPVPGSVLVPALASAPLPAAPSMAKAANSLPSLPPPPHAPSSKDNIKVQAERQVIRMFNVPEMALHSATHRPVPGGPAA